MEKVIYNAIDSTGLLSKSQKTIIKYILSFGYEKGVTAQSIQNYTKNSKQAINSNLKLLIKRNFLYRKKDRVFIYYCNQEKIQEIQEEYNRSL